MKKKFNHGPLVMLARRERKKERDRERSTDREKELHRKTEVRRKREHHRNPITPAFQGFACFHRGYDQN